MALPEVGLGLFDLALVCVYLVLLCGVGLQYRRGEISSPRLSLLVGMCALWLSYGLLQVTTEGPVPTGTPLNYALDGVAVACLVVGLYGLYRWWRHRDATESESD